jgi:hypothetical protein
MKKINKKYILHFFVKKQTRTHEIIPSVIMPDDCFLDHIYGSTKKNEICHYECFYATQSIGYGHLDKDDYRPCIMRENVKILIAKGIVCNKCQIFESDYCRHEEPEEFIKEFDAISNRNELAVFIRKARKTALQYREGLCDLCKYEEKRIKRKKEQEEFYQNWIIEEKQRKKEIKAMVDDYYARRKIKIKKTNKSSELKQAEQFFQMAQAISEIANINTEKK